MSNFTIYMNSYVTDIERKCISIIDRNIDGFFEDCKLMFHNYFYSINSLKNRRVICNEITLLEKKLRELVAKVNEKIIKEVNEYNNIDLTKDTTHIYENINYYISGLKQWSKEVETTENINKICEILLDTLICNIITCFSTSSIINAFLDKVNFGQILIGNDNNKNKKIMYNKIEGILTNIQIEVREHMINQLFSGINKASKEINSKINRIA